MATQDPTTITLSGYQGTAIAVGGDNTVWDVKPTDTQPDGIPHDITGWTFYLTVKKNYTDSEDAAVLRHDWVIEDGTDGKWNAEIPDEITLNQMYPGQYVWDMHVKEVPDAEPRYWLGGTVIIPKGVTNRIVPDLS